MGRLSFLTAALFSIAAAIFSPATLGQTYPVKPVKLLVGWAPGGGVDVTARVIAQKLSSMWGQQVIVENRPGAGGNVAADLTAKSAPDGYTIFLGTVGELAVNATLFTDLPYRPIQDF